MAGNKKENKKSYNIDMVNGPLFGKILLFAIPLMLSGVLQLLFNAADVVVVGRFAGSEALAAVGSTGSLTNLIVNLFIGLSVGTNVLVANYIGSGNQKAVSQTVHTSILASIVGGIMLVFIGGVLARPLLSMMGTPADVIDQSVLYMTIYFAGMPVNMLYNFGSAVLRATGDTRRPLYYAMVAGVINVVLNLIFVIVFHMGVAGVALATIISQGVSALLVIRCLIKEEGPCHLELRKLRIHKDKLLLMIRIGLPAGMQGCIFSISNVLIQSSINSFGSIAMAGNTAASNIEGFIYTAMNSLHQACISFTSQNYGARKNDRIKKILFQCESIVAVIGLVLGLGATFAAPHLLGIYSSDPEVIARGVVRMSIICSTYCICGMMDVFVGTLRGMNYAILPMIVSLAGACGFRILWIFTIFQWNRTLFTLYLSYPISWTITALAHFGCILYVWKKEDQKLRQHPQE